MKSAFICVHLRLMFCLFLVFELACGTKQTIEPKTTAAPISIPTATAEVRQVPADFEETGTFIAEESSQIAPVAPGRVLSTPVDVGAHVTQGQDRKSHR